MDKLIELYKKMYLIRKVEDVIIENYYNDEMKTPMHMSRGSEAISVGVCSALGNKGQYFSTYRSHAPYFASGGDLNKFFAEMYGKKEGRYAGKAGSMHIASPETGHISSSAIVASNIPVAVGAAWANKMQNNGKIVVVFFGDGALDEGNFWESINMASLWCLPILFVCEDNGLAVFTSKSKRHGYYNISDVVEQLAITVDDYGTTRVDKVYNYVKKAIKDIERTGQPSFIKFKYYRYLEHVGINEDTTPGYRDEDDIPLDDPIEHHKIIMKKYDVKDCDIKRVEEEINKQVYSSLELAKNGEISDINDVYKDVFYG